RRKLKRSHDSPLIKANENAVTMIKVDENDPIGEIQLSFPYRDAQIKRGVDPKDEYILEEEIGRGKFGTVYKCKEKSSGLYLAAKFIACPKKEDRRNVEREIDIMRALQHPRLIQVYDAFENGKIMTVILELIEGGELFERVIDDDFILTEKSCTIFMRQICEGVDFIHKQRILHLDMKVLFGTPEFVAPEVVNFEDIGYGTDMWSVGVICYVLLSGLSPFMGVTDVETMANVTVAKYDFDDEAFDEISDNAKDFIQKLLVKDVTQRLSAQECLNHEWLKRKKILRTPSMDVTKDNLKQFVERWNEHPNSPYIFEISQHVNGCPILPIGGHSLSDSSQSLLGDSPSPCGSLASSAGSDDAFINNIEPLRTTLLPPCADHLRRASDSTGVVKTHDITERINLAEEIRKLSDKLFQLSSINTNVTNNLPPFEETEETKPPEENSTKSLPIPIENGLPKDHPASPVCGIPWRKTKFKMNYTSRDVPLAARNIHKQSNDQFTTKTCHNVNVNSPNGTKDLLLQLLEHWDVPRGHMSNNRHGSVSSEWTESDSLGQRSISSLNTFFQSRATNKKITPFHFNKNAFDIDSVNFEIWPGYRARPSAEEMLNHPWLTDIAILPQGEINTAKLKRYVIKKRWIKAVNTIVALKRMGAKIDTDLI
ncbi:hypothetical protein NQ317_005260, partial [Molorchus minor]